MNAMNAWRSRLRPLLGRHPAPFYLFSAAPLGQARAELQSAFAGAPVPVRHWLSCKTQPLRPLLEWWRRLGEGIEVVSEFEFLAARAAGYAAPDILLNGPAKHDWLPRHPLPGLRVNFDSTAEARALLPLAQRLGWSCGLRLHTREEHDPEHPQFRTQFGLLPAEAAGVVRRFRRAGVPLDTLHFHLRTNIADAAVYERALIEAATFCQETGFQPRHLDCGGGFPPPDVWGRDGQAVAGTFSLEKIAQLQHRMKARFPGLEEVWLENGRWLSARSGVLVLRILDVKERDGVRHLICNGGRTLHALISTWERHRIFSMPDRRGPTQLTTLNGPTCMAFDQLARCQLPHSLRAGDHLVWMEAGAYHLPWETHFSHGLAAVLWEENGRTRVVRPAQTFEQWHATLGLGAARS